METTAGVQRQTGFLLYSSRQFSAHTKSSLARIDKRTARAQGSRRDQKIKREEGGGAGPSLLPRRDHE